MAKLYMLKSPNFLENDGIICEVIGAYRAGEILPGHDYKQTEISVGNPVVESRGKDFTIRILSGGLVIGTKRVRVGVCPWTNLVPLSDDKEGDEEFVIRARNKLKENVT